MAAIKERSKKLFKRNSPADTKTGEGRGEWDAPGARTEILPQRVEKTMVEQVVVLQPMEDHIRAHIHPAACGGPQLVYDLPVFILNHKLCHLIFSPSPAKERE